MNTTKVIYHKADGSSVEFSNSQLLQSAVKENLSNSLIGENLAIDTFSFSVRDGEEIVQFSRYVDYVELVHNDKLMGKYYVEKVEDSGQTSTTATVTAVSIIGVMDSMTIRGGVYNGRTTGALIAEIMGDYPFSIDADLSAIPCYGWMPSCSKRDGLKQLLFQAGATILKDENCNPVFSFNLPRSAKIHEETYSGGSIVNNADSVSTVYLTEHSFYQSANAESQVLFDNIGEIAADHYEIQFDEPYHSYIADGLTVNTAGTNYCIVSGNGTLKGKPFVHVRRIRNKQTGIVGASDSVSVEDAYFVSPLNSDMCLDRLANFYGQSKSVEVDLIATDEKPGDMVQIPNPTDYDQTVTGYIKKISKAYSSKIKGAAEITSGWTPKYYGASFDSSMIIRASDLVSGRWTVPSEMRGKRALVILFSGAQGGQGGWYGETGGIVRGGAGSYTSTFARPDGKTSTLTFKNIGLIPTTQEGGAGGFGGMIGRIVQISIDSLAASYPVSFGPGGEGGAGGTVVREKVKGARPARMESITLVDPESGEYGGDSVFNGISTSGGQNVDTSYINLVSGLTIATKGKAGIKGGKGGVSGQAIAYIIDDNESYEYRFPQTKGKAGESVGTYAGGAGGDGSTGQHTIDTSDNPDKVKNECPSIPGVGYIHYPLHGGAGGGGAAMGQNGNAPTGYAQEQSGCTGAQWDSTATFVSTMQIGGNGANATFVPAAAIYNGGDGGHGGGGGGSAPHCIGSESYDDSSDNTRYLGIGIGGKGGNGGKGGKGADGFALVYWRA